MSSLRLRALRGYWMVMFAALEFVHLVADPGLIDEMERLTKLGGILVLSNQLLELAERRRLEDRDALVGEPR